MATHKVSKKVERLARVLNFQKLFNCGHCDIEWMDKRVDESWMTFVEEATLLNKMTNQIQDFELSGSYTDEELKRWED